MRLSEAAQEYADSLFFRDGRLLFEQAKNDIQAQRSRSFDDLAQIDFSFQIRTAAKMAKVRIESYVTAYAREGLKIKRRDVLQFIEKAKEVIKRQAQQTQSIGKGMITMSQALWSDTYRAQMLKQFEEKAFEMLEPTINDLDIKVKESVLQASQRATMKKRWDLLVWIFERTDGRQYRSVDLSKFLEEHADWDQTDLSKASDYFDGDGLIEQKDDSGLLVWITHEGIKALEQGDETSQKDARLGLIQNVQHVNIHAPGASVVQGSGNVLNVQQNNGATTEDVIALLQELKNYLVAENQQEGLDFIEGIEAEVKNDAPSKSRIGLFLKGLGEIVKDTGTKILVEIGKKVLTGEVQLPGS